MKSIKASLNEAIHHYLNFFYMWDTRDSKDCGSRKRIILYLKSSLYLLSKIHAELSENDFDSCSEKLTRERFEVTNKYHLLHWTTKRQTSMEALLEAFWFLYISYMYTGVNPGGGPGGLVPPKISFLKLSWEPSFYPDFYFTFVTIILYFLISLLFPFLIAIAKWSF